jgi:ABC-type sugar transport system substrate-binding protein
MKRFRQKPQKSALLFIVTLMFIAMTFAPSFAANPTMKLKPKGKKKITIAVIVPDAGIEIAAYMNKFHKANAKKRGWNIKFVNLHKKIAQAASYMDNMISAGYDGIIIHWLPLKAVERQIKAAFKKGIPVMTVASTGSRFPGVIAEVGPFRLSPMAKVSEYLAYKLKRGDKVITMFIPMIEAHQLGNRTAKAIMKAFGLKVVQELMFQMSGNPFQWAYNQVTNTLLADRKKQIKGILTTWDGFGVQAARAAHAQGRDDIIVVTQDDTPSTYKAMRRLPTLHATVGGVGMAGKISEKIFSIFDAAFKGKRIVSRQVYPVPSPLVLKSNLPPPGYFATPGGVYKGRKPDYRVK